ncbi:hypothetical protein ASF61_04635 [Duganella sp. Leaf126]|nr:hypothetical protein ASF61_04635 [Duganella sp. Leaf126]
MMAQQVDVAIVFRDMLGPEDATAYMARCGLPESVVQRVLLGMAVTRIAPTLPPPPLAPASACGSDLPSGEAAMFVSYVDNFSAVDPATSLPKP